MGKPISQKKLLSIAGLGWMFDAMDVGMLSFIIAALKIDWDLTPQQMGWIGSVNSIGMAIGALLFGIWADKIGRKKIFIITLLIFSIASGISALTTTLSVFLIFRFFIGLGLGGELPVASTLVSEIVPSKGSWTYYRIARKFLGFWVVVSVTHIIFYHSIIWLENGTYHKCFTCILRIILTSKIT